MQGDDGSIKITTHETDLQKSFGVLKLRKREHKAALKSFRKLRSAMKYLKTPDTSEDEQ